MRVARFFGWALRRGHRRQEGQAGFEFVLVLPFFFVFFLLMVDLGLMTYSYISVANAAREGARFGAVNCGDGDCSVDEIRQRVVDRSGGILSDVNDVTVAWEDADSDGTLGSRGDAVSVSVDTTYDFLFIAGVSIDVVSCADMRLEQTDGGTGLPSGGGC